MKHGFAFAGLATLLGLGGALGSVGGVLGGGFFGSSPAAAATTTCTTVGLALSIRATIYKGTTTGFTVGALAPSDAIARAGDRIIYTVKVGVPAGDCHPITTGTVKLTLPNGVVKTLATRSLTLTPTVVTGTPKTLRLPTATAYVVTTGDDITHTVGGMNRGILAHAAVDGVETHAGTPTMVTDSVTLLITVIHPETTLTKSVASETNTGVVPTTVTYKITETNVSTTVDPTTRPNYMTADTLHTVSVTESGAGCASATLAFASTTTSTSTPTRNELLPGVTWTYTCTKTFTTSGSKTDTASATAVAGDMRAAGTVPSKGAPQPETATLTVTLTRVTPPPPHPPSPTPKFTVTKSDIPGSGKSVVPGATIAYGVLVTNVGTASGSATISDPLPANLTLASTPTCATVTGGDTCSVTVTASTLTMKVSLAKGDSAKVTFDADVTGTDTSTVVNTATITTGLCTAPDCSSTVTNPVAILSVVKSSTPPSGSVVPPLTKVTYTLTLTDSGTAATTPVTLTDKVPAGTTYVAGSATCGGVPGCSVIEATGTVTWTGTVVQPGAANALSVSFQAVVSATDANGQKITNVAVFTNEGTPNCSGATCTTNYVTLVVIVKTSAATSSTPPTIPQATTPHTGEPWAGSRWLELLVLFSGLGLFAIGESLRRRHRRNLVGGE